MFSYTFLKCFTFRTKEFVDQSIYGIDKIANIVISRLEISYHTKIIKKNLDWGKIRYFPIYKRKVEFVKKKSDTIYSIKDVSWKPA